MKIFGLIVFIGVASASAFVQADDAYSRSDYMEDCTAPSRSGNQQSEKYCSCLFDGEKQYRFKDEEARLAKNISMMEAAGKKVLEGFLTYPKFSEGVLDQICEDSEGYFNEYDALYDNPLPWRPSIEERAVWDKSVNELRQKQKKLNVGFTNTAKKYGLAYPENAFIQVDNGRSYCWRLHVLSRSRKQLESGGIVPHFSRSLSNNAVLAKHGYKVCTMD